MSYCADKGVTDGQTDRWTPLRTIPLQPYGPSGKNVKNVKTGPK